MKYCPKNASSCKGGWSWQFKLLTNSKWLLGFRLTKILVFNSSTWLFFLLFLLKHTFRESTFVKAEEKDRNRHMSFFFIYKQAVSTGKTETSARQGSGDHRVSCFPCDFFHSWLSRKSIRLCPVMSGACLSSRCAWKVIDFHDTTEKNRLPSFQPRLCTWTRLRWSVCSQMLPVSDFKTPFSDVLSVPLMEEHCLSPSFSWFISFWSLFTCFDWAPFEVGIHSSSSLTRGAFRTWQTEGRDLPALQPWFALFHSRTAPFLSVCRRNRKELIKRYLLLQLGMQPYFFSIQIRGTISSGKVS